MKNLVDYLALHTQITIKNQHYAMRMGEVLYSTLSSYLQNLNKDLKTEKIFILETGTARGFSAICMAKALEDNNRDGLILTYDVLPHSIKMFWNSISDNLCGPQTRSELLNYWRFMSKIHII